MPRPRQEPRYVYCLYCGDPLPEGRRANMQFCRDREQAIVQGFTGEFADELRAAVARQREGRSARARGARPTDNDAMNYADPWVNAYDITAILREGGRPKSCGDAWRTVQRHRAEWGGRFEFTYGYLVPSGYVGVSEPLEAFKQTRLGRRVSMLVKVAVTAEDERDRDTAANLLGSTLHNLNFYFPDLHTLALEMLLGAEEAERERRRVRREVEDAAWAAAHLTSIERTPGPWDGEGATPSHEGDGVAVATTGA